MSRRRAYWVHPSTHEIFKFMPHNPPERGDTVLVDGVRHQVLRCPVRWDGRRWEMKRGVRVFLDALPNKRKDTDDEAR